MGRIQEAVIDGVERGMVLAPRRLGAGGLPGVAAVGLKLFVRDDFPHGAYKTREVITLRRAWSERPRFNPPDHGFRPHVDPFRPIWIIMDLAVSGGRIGE